MNTQQKQEIQTALQASQQRLLHDPKAVPSKSYLATRAGISKSSVYNATKELAASGLIKITERFKKSVGQQTSNLYTILKSPPTVEKPIKRLRIERSVPHKLSSGSLRIYCFLKAHTAKDGICGIHLSHIAKHIGRSTRTVQRYLKSMVEKGVLKVFHDKGKKSLITKLKTPLAAIQRTRAYRFIKTITPPTKIMRSIPRFL